MLSSTCKTAIKAVIYLAAASETGEKVGIREVARNIRASEHTVGKILQLLARRGLINSNKGPSGGFSISRLQFNRPIIHIIEAIEGEQVFRECGLGLSKCSAAHPCPIHHEYKMARERVAKLFRENTLKTLCDPVSSGFAYLIG
ncbi:MAG: Rrf2 family transcriptional regulator [Bacteroidota bacterium]|nr:Rrf2 family transcriptional regulator [Bacteroidota bacterium]